MKRDMDLVRRITLAATELSPGDWLEEIEGVDADVFAEHATLMQEAGLVDATITEYLDGGASVAVKRLTWDGQEFADQIRSDTLWKKAKENVIKPSASFSFTLLREWLKDELRKGLPTLGG
ncbi:DUF2513 domain-containing protein [Achromobacter pestifer]